MTNNYKATATRYGTSRAAETNAMRFLPPAKPADRSRNFSRSTPRTTGGRKTIR